VSALLALGTVMLCSSPKAHLMNQQLVWVALGTIVCATVAALDYRKLKRGSWVLLAVVVVLLAAVFLPSPIGIYKNGAHRWLNLRISSLQPSELAKVALIVAIGWYGERFQRHMPTFKRGLLVPALFIVPVLGLIVIEPDYGTTLLLAAVSAIMLVIAGVRLTLVVPALLVGGLLISASVAHNKNRMERLDAFIHPERHAQDRGYQQLQAQIALGSGGVTGIGLGDGRQKYGYVPENHTDFILSIVGEELGLVATLGVVVAFICIGLCGVFIASNACDRFGMLVGCGITFLILLQAIINIGVVTSLLPNKGLPLPFVSYGGSSVVAMLGCVGLLFSIARHARETAPRSRRQNPFNPEEIPSTQLS